MYENNVFLLDNMVYEIIWIFSSNVDILPEMYSQNWEPMRQGGILKRQTKENLIHIIYSIYFHCEPKNKS